MATTCICFLAHISLFLVQSSSIEQQTVGRDRRGPRVWEQHVTVCQHRHNLKQCHGNQHSLWPQTALCALECNWKWLLTCWEERVLKVLFLLQWVTLKYTKCWVQKQDPSSFFTKGWGVSHRRNKLSGLGNPQESLCLAVWFCFLSETISKCVPGTTMFQRHALDDEGQVRGRDTTAGIFLTHWRFCCYPPPPPQKKSWTRAADQERSGLS